MVLRDDETHFFIHGGKVDKGPYPIWNKDLIVNAAFDGNGIENKMPISWTNFLFV